MRKGESNMERLAELRISGMGKANGGKFSYVDISGLGKVLGDVEAERITISGKGTIEGNASINHKLEISGMGTISGSVKGGQLVSSGTGSVGGEVDVSVVESSGNLKICGEAKVGELHNNGRMRFERGLKAEKMVSHGLLSVGGDLEAEDFYSQGSFSVGGLLNAQKMNIEIHGYCQAKEIGGEEILVRSGRYISLSILSKLVSPFLGQGRELDRLTADLIEGTVVSLEYTTAKVVRGNKIKLGPGCVIDLVEYTDTIDIDPQATVKKHIKI
jgi:cytoskeletal protein CcmA (bactofilin family)